MTSLTDTQSHELTNVQHTPRATAQAGMSTPHSHSFIGQTATDQTSHLLFSLDRQGRLLSINWPAAQRHGIRFDHAIGQPLTGLIRSSQAGELDTFLASFASQDELISTPPSPWVLDFAEFRLTGYGSLSALRLTDQRSQLIGVMQDVQVSRGHCLPLEISKWDYRTRLTQLLWDIRDTLDLKTIWQQTVDGLTATFNADWCGLYQYVPGAEQVFLIAEAGNSDIGDAYRDPLVLSQHPGLQAAIFQPGPIAVHPLGQTDAVCETLLVAATCYQQEPNSLILLQAAAGNSWQPLDHLLFQDIADQIGTAIAHGQLFQEAQGLADDLQSANKLLIKQHRELEEASRRAEEASRLKSEFLANTSHELRTPLNGMIGFLKLILDGMADDPEEQQEFLHEAHKSAIHLLNLINDVLDIAKIEAGKMQIDMSPVKISDLFADVENFTRPQAEQKRLTFEIVLPPTRDEIIINGNYQRLLQVILNLVGNAIKFTHEGSITISAQIKSQKVIFQDKEWPGIVKVSVADTGIGVSLEKQDRLFQTFSQVDGERTRQYGGTGLGLAISQRLIEAMGGVVQFISMGEGLGSTVTFTALLYQEPVMVE